MNIRKLFACAILTCLFAACAVPAFSQSTTTGGFAGVVSDPSGAVVAKAKVSAKSDATGATQNTATNDEGYYRFSLLSPGHYTISVNAAGFEPVNTKATVALNQVTTINIPLVVGTKTETIEVTASVVQVETADLTTTFSVDQVAQLPNPGNDLSAVAQTAPGVVMNTGGGFGNFSSFGLPATSNLFTLNGMNDNDPFLNLNNSGPTNLLLGANDVQEATVVNNGYSPQYGQLAGAQINYVTKSGTNQWHGNAVYYWNGRALNSNDYFNNATQTPIPFDNVNQWAVGIGGPIRKDKTFFYYNYEGLRVVLPTSAPAFIPSQQLESAITANLTGGAGQNAFYQNMFNLYNGAPGAAAAVTSSTCGAAGVTLPGLSAASPCIQTFQSTAGNFTHEYTMNLRLDQIFSDADKVFGRAQVDRGVQATFTDPINPVFNDVSTQPEFQTQIGWTHVFGSSAVNEFKLSDLWYSAFFNEPNRAAAVSAFPTNMFFLDGSLTGLGGIDFNFPQGRNVNQYQFVDDFQMTRGNHTFKFGANFHRDDVTDDDYGILTGGQLLEFSLQDFANGSADLFSQNFPQRLTQPIALYSLGFYAGDEWRVTKRLKVSFALRLDHNSNPVCQTNCFARLTEPFTTLSQTPNVGNLPYNQVIQTGLHQAYPSTDIVVWQPRLGFTWSPFADNKTVISGGVGIFTDSFPATVVDSFSKNSPVSNSFTIGNTELGPLSDSPSMFAHAAGANSAFNAGFAAGGTLASINAANPDFGGINFTSAPNEIRQPRYQEWNLRVQRDIGWRSAISLNYVGNHGIFEVVANSGVNAFFPTAAQPVPNFSPSNPNPFPSGFNGLPIGTPSPIGGFGGPDPAFNTVTQLQSIATSNYNGLVTSIHHDFSHGLQFQANYTWSHALDEISNAGLLPYNTNTAASIGTLTNPFNLRANYGNADYDIRHNFTANYVWENSLRHLFHWGPNAVFSGWNFSGTVFVHSGQPLTIIDNGTTGTLNGFNYGGPVFANVIGSTAGPVGCNVNATNVGNTPNPCFNVAGFSAPNTPDASGFGNFGNQARNQFRGPGYFDTDFTVSKHNKIPGLERGELNVGFQFFNLFNHPNLDNPVNDINNPRFGLITRTVNTPTSILGSFLGGDASPRLIQLKTEFRF